MSSPISTRSVSAFIVVLVVTTACTDSYDLSAPVSNDNRAAGSAMSPVAEPTVLATDGSLASLTGEVRQLRIAVERLTQTHVETQTLTGYLSAQQARVGQVSERLDAARKDVEVAFERSQQVEAQLSILAEDLARISDQSQRLVLDQAVNGTRAEKERLDQVLRQARDRESELLRELQLEQAQWNELVARAEQITR